MIKYLHLVLILSIYTCDRIPSDDSGSAGSARRRQIITSVLRMCLITSALSIPDERFCSCLIFTLEYFAEMKSFVLSCLTC
jgi:hypothetical protein